MTWRRLRTDDTGASLVFALVVVTVFSVVIAVVLAFADTSLRVTIALRGQATNAASADGAAQIAINKLRLEDYDGRSGQCFQTSDTLLLPDFYQPPTGAADSAAITCALDGPRSGGSEITINPQNRPANAILTLGTGGGEDGLNVNVADGRNLAAYGGVFSNSTIAVPAGSLSSNQRITARGACTGVVTSVPPAACNIGTAADPRGDDPNYAPPPPPTVTQAVPSCNVADQVLTFQPGRYTNIGRLNLNGERCPNSTFHFTPGVYYFDFEGTWIINNSYLVGGTLTAPLVPGTPPTIPGSCQAPIPPRGGGPWTPPGADAGVTIVFARSAGLRLVGSARAELCGTYATDRPPIVLYGLKANVTGPLGTILAQSGCIVGTPYPSTGCPVLQTQPTAAGRLYIQGTTYVPNAAIDVVLTNPGGVAFSDGIIARTFRIAPTAGADLTNPVIEVPDEIPQGRLTVLYLNVYLCPGSGTCDSTGTPRLRIKVGITDPTGSAVAGVRQITVYTWSVQR